MIRSAEEIRKDAPGSDMQDIPPQGSITEVFFPRLVARLHRDGFEGAVRVVFGPTTKILYFKHGEIASAASNAESDRLAAILILDGRLTEPQLEMARSRLPPGGSLGRTLIEMGFLTPSELLQGARRQVRQILSTCCTLKSGTYQIEPGPLPPEVTVLGIPTKRLIFDCVLESRDRGAIVREVGSMESVYSPSADLLGGLTTLKLDIEHDQVARMLDGTSSLRDLSGRTSLDDFTVSKLVLALEILGMAELFGTPAPVAPPRPPGRAIPIESEDDQTAEQPLRLESDAGERETAPSRGGLEGETPTVPAAEPPPIPEEELPAFAVTPEAEPQWQIDPKTGERVHMGPIELTFEGKVGPRRREVRSLRMILLAAGGVTLLIGSAALLLGRRSFAPEPPRPRQSPQPQAESAPTPALESPTPPLGSAPSPTIESPAPPPGPPAPPLRSPEPAPSAGPPTPAAPPPAAMAAVPPARRPEATREEKLPLPSPPRGSISPFREPTRYVAALRRLDTGDVSGAAHVFQELASMEAGRYTLQLMIACAEETVRTARAQSGEGGSLFVLPFSLKGRSCYRVCWGTYPGREEARAAIEALPTSLKPAGGAPLILSVDRLRPQ